jgi:hypothetical protein
MLGAVHTRNLIAFFTYLQNVEMDGYQHKARRKDRFENNLLTIHLTDQQWRFLATNLILYT